MALNFILGLVISLLAVVACLAFPILAGAWILRPLDLAAKRYRRPTRFTILDFFGLIFLVQMPMALTHGLVPREEAAIFWIFLGLGWLVSVAVWGMAVKTFSNAGIENVWTRAMLVFFVLPMAYFGTFAVVGVALVARFNPADSIGPWLLQGALEIALVCGIIAAGWLTRRVAPKGWRGNASGTSPFSHGNPPAPGVTLQQVEVAQAREEYVAKSVDHLFRGPSLD